MKKKYYSLVLIPLMVSLMSGCGGSSSNNNQLSLEPTSLAPLRTIGSGDEDLNPSTPSSKKSENNKELVGLLGNFDDGKLHESIVIDKPTYGDLKLFSNGTYIYHPSSDFNGSDSFSYKVDANSSCPAKVVTINNQKDDSATLQPVSELSFTNSLCKNLFRLSWLDNSEGESGYAIYLDDKLINILPANSSETLLDPKIGDDEIHKIKVAPLNGSEVSFKKELKFTLKDGKVKTISHEVVKVFDPKIISSMDLGNNSAYGFSLSKDDTRLYISSANGDLRVIDLSKIDALKEINSKNISHESYRSHISHDGKTLFIAGYQDKNMIYIIDISDPDNPKLIYSSNFNSNTVYDVAISKDDKKLYVEDSYTGVRVFDISTLTSPSELALIEINIPLNHLDLSNDNHYLFVSNHSNQTLIYDVSDVQNISKVATIPMDNEAVGVLFSKDGKRAYIADKFNNIKIVDISDIKNPKILSTIADNGTDIDVSMAISKDGSKLFVGEYESINIYNIQDEKNPTFIQKLKFENLFNHMELSNDGDYLYLTYENSNNSTNKLDVIKLYKEKIIE